MVATEIAKRLERLGLAPLFFRGKRQREVIMRLLRPTTIIVAFLTIAISIPQLLFSQTAARQQRPKRSQRADALASAIKELSEANPLNPESPDEKGPEENASADEDKPPADEAPINELVNYWINYTGGYGAQLATPSDKVRQRLLEAVEDRTELLPSLMNYLPESADTHDRLYKLLNEEPDGEETWKPRAREWLAHNSAYFRDDLIKAALTSEEHIHTSMATLASLARLDWNAARPILEKFASAGHQVMTPAALTYLYWHAAEEGDSALAESYRPLLKATVANRQAEWLARVISLAGLMDSEWNGQEEWFISLFADPTLSGVKEDAVEGAAESKKGASVKADAADDAAASHIDSDLGFLPGILDTAIASNTKKWLPVVSNLVGHNHRTVHKGAVKCLVKTLTSGSSDDKTKKEIARKLTPWLTEPGWAAEDNRGEFIHGLVDLNLPELAPGLIWILEHDEEPYNRALAAEALTKYRDQRAIPALRHALEKENHEEFRGKIVTALAECSGFSDDEMAAAVEAYARKMAAAEGKEEIEMVERYQSPDSKTLPLEVSIGRVLNESATIQTTEGMALRLIERAKSLRAKEPAVAREILRVIEATPLRVVEINLVERIGEGWADADSIKLALETRDTLMKSAGDELYRLIKEGGYAAGVAAAITDDEREWKSILESGDAKAQLALLTCARYLRDKLPVELVARLLNSPNRVMAKATAKAAESYLEIEDSVEARKMVLARHPGEAYILGDLLAISRNSSFIETAQTVEDALRKEVRDRNGPDAIYAVTQKYSPELSKGVVIRVRDAKAEMSVYETTGRRKVRWLTAGEFEELRSFTSRQEIEDLGPEKYPAENDFGLTNYEYLRLTKEGGRRIVFIELRRATKHPTLHEELSGLFYRLSRSGEFTTRYDIEDKIPGLELVFADKDQSALKVCAEGDEIRVLIEEKGSEYKRGAAKPEPEWREFSSGKPGEVRDEPSACRKLPLPSSSPKNAIVISPNRFGQPAQSDGAMFYVTYGEDSSIWKIRDGLEPVKIVSGDYYNPVITADGKWLLAFKQVTEGAKTDRRLIRRNLQSGEEFVISLPQNTFGLSLIYVAAHGKVLAGSLEIGETGRGYLIDQETGTVQPVKGEFGPLPAPDSRAPQQGGTPNQFWTANFDSEKGVTKFGFYDTKNFVFTPLLQFPGLRLSDDDIWVDSAGGKIWFTYQGHLLRMPLPPFTKSN
jgi:HEAT repeat protein